MLALALSCVTVFLGACAASAADWPAWRGPLATGEAPGADPPVHWSEGQNVRWKLELPGRGHSSPVVWGDHVFLTTAIPVGEPVDPRRDSAEGSHHNIAVRQRHEFAMLAVDRGRGRVLWKRTLAAALPREGGHYTGSLASHSPVTDGEHVFAFFGSRGLYALGHDGAPVWEVQLGEMQTKHGHGEGSSPVLYGDTLIVNWDHAGQSFLAAFEKSTGRRRWKVPRDEVTSWASPIVVEHAGQKQVVVSGTGRLRGYDLASGEVVWECGGLSANVVASPVAGGGMVFAASSYDKQALLAIRLEGAQGDLTGTDHVAWTRSRDTPYVPSPLLYEGSLYVLKHYQGVLTRLVAETGEERSRPFRLTSIGNVYASPVAASGRIYITDRDGATIVLSHAATPEVLALNHLDDSFSASAALVDRELFLRGQRFLYSVSEE